MHCSSCIAPHSSSLLEEPAVLALHSSAARGYSSSCTDTHVLLLKSSLIISVGTCSPWRDSPPLQEVSAPHALLLIAHHYWRNLQSWLYTPPLQEVTAPHALILMYCSSSLIICVGTCSPWRDTSTLPEVKTHHALLLMHCSSCTAPHALLLMHCSS
jgi:hypothetical protein